MELVNFIKEKSIRMQLFYALCIYVVALGIRIPFIILGYEPVATILLLPGIAAGIMFAINFIRFWIDCMKDSKVSEEKANQAKKQLNDQGIPYNIGFNFKKSRIKLRVVYSLCLLANILSLVSNVAIVIGWQQ